MVAAAEVAGEHASPGYLVEETLALLVTDEFRQDFVALQTAEEIAALQACGQRLRPSANQVARQLARSMVADELGVDPEHGPRTMGSQWHAAMRDRSPSMKDDLLSSAIVDMDVSATWQGSQQELYDALEFARMVQGQQLDGLLAQLAMQKCDPGFVAAANAWGNTPNRHKATGEAGQGFNGGLVHFFEYQADPEKSRRFRYMEEPLTVSGFMSLTERLMAEMTDRTAGRNRRAVLCDTEGNMRFYVLCPNSEFIVGFQRPSEPDPRLTSLITPVVSSYFNRVVKGTLAGKDRGVLNKLGPDVQRIE
jgi:hypothetical protein